MTTDELRDAFLAPTLFQAGKLLGTFTDLDRMVVAGAMPTENQIDLGNHPETGRESFLERRELGAINTGGPGKVIVDGETHDVPSLGCIYVGMGAEEVSELDADDGFLTIRGEGLDLGFHAPTTYKLGRSGQRKLKQKTPRRGPWPLLISTLEPEDARAVKDPARRLFDSRRQMPAGKG